MVPLGPKGRVMTLLTLPLYPPLQPLVQPKAALSRQLDSGVHVLFERLFDLKIHEIRYLSLACIFCNLVVLSPAPACTWKATLGPYGEIDPLVSQLAARGAGGR